MSQRIDRFINTRKRRTNYILAHKLLKVINDNLHKYQKEFKKLVHKMNIKSHIYVEDVFYDTLLKCYNTIYKNGFYLNKEYNNKGLSAYFTGALNKNLINFNKNIHKEDNDLQHKLTYEHFSQVGEDQFVMYINDKPTYSDDDDDIEEIYVEMLRNIKLKNAFEKLPKKFRDVLNMRYDGISYKDISRILSIPQTTVKMRLNTARTLLKNNIKK